MICVVLLMDKWLGWVLLWLMSCNLSAVCGHVAEDEGLLVAFGTFLKGRLKDSSQRPKSFSGTCVSFAEFLCELHLR